MAPPPVLINIQFLRFVAALVVVLFHASHHISETGRAHCLMPVQSFGFAGVDIFFVISGFIMWHTNRDTRGSREAWRFLHRRLARIYTGYWPFFVLMLASSWIYAPARLEELSLPRSFLLLPQAGARLIPVSWTLTFELYFYLAFFLLLFFRRRLSILAGAFLGVFLVNVYASLAVDSTRPPPFAFRFLLSAWALQFMLGCFVAIVCERWRRHGGLSILLGVAVFGSAAILNATTFEGELDRWFHNHWRVPLFGIGAALLVYGLVALERSRVALLPRFSVRAGGASYCIYLCHSIFLALSTWTGLTAWLARAQLLNSFAALLFAALVVLFSVVYYDRVERPLYRWAREPFGRRGAARTLR